jgi:competence protein ComEC
MLSASRLIAERAPLLPIATSLIIGIVVGVSLPFLHFSWISYLVFATSIGLAILARHRNILQSILVCFCFILLGMLLAARQQERLQMLISDKEQLLEAVVVSEPTEKAKSIAVQIVLCQSGQQLTCYLQKEERSRLLQPGNGIQIITRINQGWHYSLRCYASSRKWQVKHVSWKSLSRLDRARIVFLRWRHQLLQHYRLLGGSDDAYAVLAAMTLGDKSALNTQLRDTYSVTGASHVLALSGLHLGIIYIILSTLMQQRRKSGLGPKKVTRILPQVVLVISIWTFAMLVGLPVSVVRSSLMISIFALFSLGYRTHLSINLLCLSAIIIVLSNPLAVFDVGFQLSYAAVFGILLFMPRLMPANKDRRQLQKQTRLSKVYQGIKSCIIVSLVAQISVAPILAFYFGRFSTYFLLTNLVVLPTAYLILCGTLLMFITLPFSFLSATVSSAVIWIVELLNHILSMIAKLPMASIEGLHPSVVQLFLYYLCIMSLYGALLVWQGKWFDHRE